MKDYSSNAVLSKARALYGKHLGAKDFSAMLSCKSVPELAYYLKNNTYFSKELSGVNEAEIHREKLELFLRQRKIDTVYSMCLYENENQKFAQFFILEAEISQILHAAAQSLNGRSDENMYLLPLTLGKLSEINYDRLSKSRSFFDILEALKGSRYYKILSPLYNAQDAEPSYSAVESSLYKYLYNAAFDVLVKRSDDTTEIESLLKRQVDIKNFFSILRLKLLYKADKTTVMLSLLPGGFVSQKKLSLAADCEKAEQIAEFFPEIKKRIRDDEEFLSPGIENRLIFTGAQHTLRFTTNPDAAMLSYFILLDIEIYDIIAVIEGIRYGVPLKDIYSSITILNAQPLNAQTGGES